MQLTQLQSYYFISKTYANNYPNLKKAITWHL